MNLDDNKQPFMVITTNNKFVSGNKLQQYAQKSEGQSNQIQGDPFTDNYGQDGLINPPYNPSYLLSLADANTYHDVSCDAQSLDVCNNGWSLKPIDDNASEKNYDTLHAFFSKVMEDNPFRKAQRDKADLGYCCVEIVRAMDNLDADIVNINHVPAHTVRIHKSMDKYCQIRGNQKAWFKRFAYERDVALETGTEYEKIGSIEQGTPATEMLWNVTYTSSSSYYGRPRIIPALRAMYGSLSLAEYNTAFFDNYGIPAYAVFISGNYKDSLVDESDPTQGTKLQAAVREKFAAAQENPHSTMVFSVPSDDEEGKVEIRFERLSVETKEASFRLYRQDNRDEILTAHRMDPYRVGVNPVGQLAGNVADRARENYKASVQLPESQDWEVLINMVIQHKYGFDIQDWRFEFNKFDLSDKEKELKIIEGLFRNGIITPNQIINKYKEEYGLEEVTHPSMDAHYINGVPLDYTPEVGEPVEEATQIVKDMRERIRMEVEKYDLSSEGTKDNGRNLTGFRNLISKV